MKSTSSLRISGQWLDRLIAKLKVSDPFIRVSAPRYSLPVTFTAFALFLLGLMWGTVVTKLRAEREAEIATIMTHTANLARAFEEHTLRTIKEVDHALQFVQQLYQERGARLDLMAMAENGPLGDAHYDLGILDDRGNLIISTQPFQRVNLADREHFQVHAQRETLYHTFIGKPLAERVSERTSIHFSRRVNGTDFSFGGVVVASLDPDYFSDFYGTLNLGKGGLVQLVGRDGVVRARRTGDETTVGQNISHLALFRHFEARPHGTYLTQGAVDGTRRIVSYRALADYPLVIVVGLAEGEALAAFDQRARAYYQAAGVASAVILVFSALLLVMIRRRERSERKLQETHGRLDLLLETMPAVPYTSSPQGDYGTTYVGASVERVTGFTKAQFCGESGFWANRIHPEDKPRTFARLVNLPETGEHYHEYRWRVADETYRWFADHLRLLRKPDGSPGQIAGIWTDITARKQEKVAQARLAAIVEQSNDAIVSRALDGTITSWNAGAQQMFGYTAGEAIGRPITLLMPPDLPFRLARNTNIVLAGGPVEPFETRRMTKDGTMIDVLVSVSPLKDDRGQVTGASAIFHDISERKRAQQTARRRAEVAELVGALATAASKAATPLDAMQACLGLIYAYGNWTIGRVALLKPDEDKPVLAESIWRGDAPRFQEFMRISETYDYGRLSQSGAFLTVVLRDKKAAWVSHFVPELPGSRLQAAVTAGLLSGFAFPVVVHGKVSAFLEFYSEQPRAPDELLLESIENVASQLARLVERGRAQSANGQLAAIVRAADDAIISCSRDGTILSWNIGAEAIFGYSASEAIGQSNVILYPGEEAEKFPRNLELAVQGMVSRQYEAVRRAKDGRRIDVAVTVFPIRDEAGDFISLGVIYRDVTRQKALEQQVQRKARLTGLLESLARTTNEATTPEEAIRRCLELICRHGGWTLGAVSVFGPTHSGVPQTVFRYGAEDLRFTPFVEHSNATDHTATRGHFVGRVLREKRPVWIPDLTRVPVAGRMALAAQCGLRSAFAFPVLVENEAAAILEFLSEETRQPDTMMLEAVASVGAQLARLAERQRATDELRKREHRLRLVTDNVPAMIAYYDAELRCRFANHAYCEFQHIAPERIIGMTLAEITGEATYGVISQTIPPVREGKPVTLRREHRAESGEIRHIEIHRVPDVSPEGQFRGYYAMLRDVSEEVRAEQTIRASEAKARSAQRKLEGVLASLSEVVYSCKADTLEVEYVSPAVEIVTGHAPQAFAADPALWFRLVHPEDRGRVQAALARLREEGRHEIDYRIVRTDGEVRTVRNTAQIVRDEQRRPSQIDGIVTDITERRYAEEQIAYLSQYDVLTGLPNRTLFRDRLGLAIARARRHAEVVGIMLFNLDRFKQVNEGLGLEAGDDLLRQVAARLKDTLRDVDTIARLGGDEFAILAEGVPTSADVSAIAEKLVEAFAAPFAVKGTEVVAIPSIGITIHPNGTDEPGKLLEHAEIAMEHVKREGGGGYLVYEAEPITHDGRRLDLETRLRHALARGELSLHYQPKVGLSTGAVTGAEALLRWNNPELGAVSPARFIPIAEESGLIIPIGDWVLRTACAQMQVWHQRGYPIEIAVNLSPRQFRQKDLARTVAEALKQSGLAPGHLELEITEGTAMANAERTISILGELHGLGLKLAVDDFGTGYSSLAYLKRFPLHSLKIDRSFVTDIGADANSDAIVSATIALAHSLNLKVVAEGVETEVQRSFLDRADCDEMQGYLYSRPLPAEKFLALLEARSRGLV